MTPTDPNGDSPRKEGAGKPSPVRAESAFFENGTILIKYF